jgi:hypothetical protein
MLFRVLGNVGLHHEIGQSWTTHATYSRNVGFVEGFLDPMLQDSVTAGITGLVSRSINVLASATYSHGTPANAPQSGREHEAVSANARLQKALTQNLALFAQYVYYRTNTGTALQPATAFAEFDRQVVRAGLTAWMPLIR